VRLLQKFMLVLGLAFILPAVVLAVTAHMTLRRVAEGAEEKGTQALRGAEKERQIQLSRHHALMIEHFLGQHQADVDALAALYQRLERGEGVTIGEPASAPYEGADTAGLPPYGYVHPTWGAYADYEHRGQACPWLPRPQVEQVRADPAFREHISRELDQLMAMTPFLSDVLSHRRQSLDLVWIVLADGPNNVQPPYDYPAMIAADPAIPDVDERQQDYVLLLDEEHNKDRQTRWLEPYLDPFKGVWMTSCVAPMYRGDRFLGTVGLDVLLPIITSQVIDLEARSGGYAFLLAASGRIIAVSPDGIGDLAVDDAHRQALAQIFEPVEAQHWTSALQQALQTSLAQSTSQDVQALQAAMRGQEQGEAEISLSGEKKLITFARVPSSGWSLGVVVPVSKVHETAAPIGQAIHAGGMSLIRQFWLFVLALGGASVGFAVLTHQQALVPLARLTERVGRLSWERLDYQPRDAARRDELGRLDRKFHEAVGQIRRSRDEVELRRAELEDANRRLTAVNTDLAIEVEHRQQAQAALRHEMETLSVTLRSIGDAVLVTDAAGRITMLNPVAEELTGWPETLAVGRPLAEVFVIEHEETGQRVPDPVHRVLGSGRVVGLANHTRLIARDGAGRSIADSAAPIRNGAGVIQGVILVFRDVSGQRRLDAELARIQALETVGLLAAGIAHDFNNLLSAIQGNLSLLEGALPGGEVGGERLARASKAVDRARDLTVQLLTFSTGGEPVRRILALPDLLRDATSFALRGATIAARFEIAGDLWAVDADAGQISQVLQNLVINAEQAMPGGGTITVSARNYTVPPGDDLPLPLGPYVRVGVRDRGTGIPESLLGRIFSPFFSTKPRGSGLGLAVCHSVILKHGGHIAVESRVGEGSLFEFWLPASPTAPVAAEVTRPLEITGKGRILVMDDDVSILEVAADMLASLGYQAECVPDGETALERCAVARGAGQPYDLLILDLTVPGRMGGAEVVQRLSELADTTRAVVSSGYSNDPIMADPAAHGFAGMVRKPYGMRDLGRELKRVLG
jgi:PAS domain S-box-containing protein